MGTGTLSVIMANYNHSCFIGEALEAILSQSFRPLEVIVIDDGSTDDSVAIIEQFTKRDPIIRLVRNDRNRGAVFSQSRALSMASGDYVYGASADDRILPGFFEKSMSLLARYPQAGLCCSDPVWFDDHTGSVNIGRLGWSNDPRYLSPGELVELIRGNFIAGHASIVKRSALLEVGGFIPELKWHCDLFALFVIAFRYGICYIPEPLAAMRTHSRSFSASGMRDRSQQCEVLNHMLRLLKLPEYRDVLPYFARGNVMSHFEDEIVRVVMNNPEHWDTETLMLIQEPLWSWNLKLKQGQAAQGQRPQQTTREISTPRTSVSAPAQQPAWPPEALSYLQKADQLLAQGDLVAARDALWKVLSLVPDTPQLIIAYGNILLHLNDTEGARRQFVKATVLFSDYAPAHLNLATALLQLGHIQEAEAAVHRALTLNPNDEEARRLLNQLRLGEANQEPDNTSGFEIRSTQASVSPIAP